MNSKYLKQEFRLRGKQKVKFVGSLRFLGNVSF